MKRRTLLLVAALLAFGMRAGAQTSQTSAGSAAAALYSRAMAAQSPDDARRDLLRIVVDYSSTPRAEDALLQLAQMEISRGDRAAAKQYLERLSLEHPNGATRAKGAFLLGRALADDGEMVQACALLGDAKAKVAPNDFELANQIAYAARPCAAVQRALDSARADSIDAAARAARADSVARADSIAKAEAAAKKKAKSAARKTAATKSEASKAAKTAKTTSESATGGAWSAQVAAYDSREAADALAKKMSDRGYEARVTNEKPFRVRIGRYARRSDAADLIAKLKAAKIEAIVVEAEKP